MSRFDDSRQFSRPDPDDWRRETYGWRPTRETYERFAASESDLWATDSDFERSDSRRADDDSYPSRRRTDRSRDREWGRDADPWANRERSWRTQRELSRPFDESLYTSASFAAPRFTDASLALPRRAAPRGGFRETVYTASVQLGRRLNQALYTRRKLRSWQVAVIVVLLISFFGSSIGLVLGGFQQYNQLKALGNDGVQHLLSLKTLLSETGKGAGLQDKAKAVLQPAILSQMQHEADAAFADFQQIDAQLHGGVVALAGVLPPFNSKVAAVGHLAKVGMDVAQIIRSFVGVGPQLAPIFASSLFAPTGPPILTPKIFDLLTQLLTTMQPQVNDIAANLAAIQIGDVPVNGKQRDQLAQAISQLPQITQTFGNALKNLPMLRWALGVDGPRHFLVQTMDRAELRPGGGFTGQFGLLNVTSGRLGSISLTDVTTLDDYYKGHKAPDAYRSWWPFGSFGLRESNLSGDFPTSAKLALSYYQTESGQQADGDITLSVLVIAHLLADDILGPVTLPCYKATVTAQNLEDQIHFYQLGGGVSTDIKCTGGDAGGTTVRKSFTASLATAVQEKVRTLQGDRLSKLLASVSSDFAAKNIQVYLGDPHAQTQLAADGLGATMLRDGNTDATFIVQANIGANKGNIFVATKATEAITLDADGNAHHKLNVTMAYRPTGNLYAGNSTTMRDYIRVYVPANAKYESGSGFDQTTSDPLCYGACTPKQAPVCDKTKENPTGAFLPSQFAPTQPRTSGSGIDSQTGGRITDDIGPPTNRTSDEPQRAMMGGLVIIPEFCTATWSLQWSVPHIAGKASQHNLPYTFTAQRQSGSNIDLTLSITPAAGAQTAAINAHLATLDKDRTWTLGTHP